MDLALKPLNGGRLTARLAATPAERGEALALRRLCFRSARGLDPAGEGDAWDALSAHLLVKDGARLLSTCRLRLLGRADLAASYTGQFYDLAALAPLPALEIGRFCLAPGAEPDALRLTFAALTRIVDASGAGLLLGCSSFEGTELGPYLPALAAHASRLRRDTPARGETLKLGPAEGQALPLPPLLRHYLALGASLSDHAVIDRALKTAHVLTVLPVAAIPAAHARALRRLAAGA